MPMLNRRWVLASGVWVVATPVFGRTNDLIVDTTSGRVEGAREGEVLAFKGVPYGEPTGGASRFMPPTPRKQWTGVRPAVEFGNSSPQVLGASPPGFHAMPIPVSPPSPQSEDCLVLNVWTPSLTGKRAVLFWLHGGGMAYGSGSSRWATGANFARKQDMVVVTINHRLNAFGFTDLSAYGPQYAHSGNAGMLDCVLALEWVRDNIPRFGADPSRVMIVGESGGGSKVSTLMAMPSAKGLFHAAVMQSGVALRVDDKPRGAHKARRLIDALSLSAADVSRIHQVSTEDLRVAGARANAGFGGWRPVLDDQVLPAHPFDPGAPAISRDVPMITGTNRTEDSLFMGVDPAMDALTDDGLKAKIAAAVPPGAAEAVYAAYRRQYPGRSNAEIAYMVVTDRGFFLDSVLAAERKAALGGAPAYQYIFARETPVQGGRYFSPHASEIPFVFDTLEIAGPSAGPVTPETQALADAMSTAWANFAKDGRPKASGLPAWPAYDSTRRATMIFDPPGLGRVEDDPRGEQRRLMAGFGSTQLTPRSPTY